jgi:hypothetical protein
VLYIDTQLPIEAVAYGTTSGVVNAPCAQHGVYVWVATSEATTPEDPVYLQFTTGTGAVGTFRTDADTSGSARAVLVTGCRWAVTSPATSRGLLFLNLP